MFMPCCGETQDTIICKVMKSSYILQRHKLHWSRMSIFSVNSQSPSVKPEEDIIYYLEVKLA